MDYVLRYGVETNPSMPACKHRTHLAMPACMHHTHLVMGCALMKPCSMLVTTSTMTSSSPYMQRGQANVSVLPYMLFMHAALSMPRSSSKKHNFHQTAVSHASPVPTHIIGRHMAICTGKDTGVEDTGVGCCICLHLSDAEHASTCCCPCTGALKAVPRSCLIAPWQRRTCAAPPEGRVGTQGPGGREREREMAGHQVKRYVVRGVCRSRQGDWGVRTEGRGQRTDVRFTPCKHCLLDVAA